MFYCEKCANKNGWPFDIWRPMSRGPCECCGKVSVCADTPSYALPDKKPKKTRKSG